MSPNRYSGLSRWLPLWLLLGLGLGACADSGLSKERTSCFNDDDCSLGQSCSLGACGFLPTFKLDLEVTPLPASGFLFQEIDNIDLGTMEPLRVLVAPPLALSVSSPLDAKARFTTSGGLRSPRSFDALLEREAGETVATTQLSLIAGVRDGRSGALVPMTYDVQADPLSMLCCVPGAPCAAPSAQRGLSPTADSAYVLPLDVETPPVAVRGQIFVSEANWTPVENLQVQVFDPDSNVRSLSSATDSEGRFCVSVVPPLLGAAHHLTLRLGPSGTRPTLEFPDLVVEQDDVDLGTRTTGDHGTPIAISGNKLLGPEGQPLAGAQVTYLGEVTSGGHFRQSVQSDALGAFEVTLLPGLYQVFIRAPENAFAASQAVTDYLVPARSAERPLPLVLSLTARPFLRGSLFDAAGSPVPEAELIARPRVEGASDLPQSYRTHTDAEGRFELPVDPGDYRLDFRPRAGSGLPWSVGHIVSQVVADLELPPLSLEQPTTLRGSVLGQPAGESTLPLAGAQVEILGRDSSGLRLPVGAAWTDESGSFEASIPRSLTSSTGR